VINKLDNRQNTIKVKIKIDVHNLQMFAAEAAPTYTLIKLCVSAVSYIPNSSCALLVVCAAISSIGSSRSSLKHCNTLTR